MQHHCALTDKLSVTPHCAQYAYCLLHCCCLQDAEQVVPKLVQILHELPGVWTARQNGPLQAQADFTQLMMDLRW